MAQHPPVAAVSMAHSSEFSHDQEAVERYLVLCRHPAQPIVELHVHNREQQFLRIEVL